MIEEDAFLAFLNAQGGDLVTVELPALRAAGLATGADPERLREDLAAVLCALEGRGLLTLPARRLKRGNPSWDEDLAPPLPRWVRLVRERITRERRWRDEVWHPRLQWVRELSTLGDRQYMFLRRVHEGLCTGKFDTYAPLKRRSLELTGHEKRLGQFENGALFGDERLTPELLGCGPLPYLTHERVGDAPVALVFENRDPFVLALRAARETRQSRFGVIVYGAGNSAPANVAHLTELGVRGAHYVGDLDRAGLEIGARFVRACAHVNVRVQPATGWQRQMLREAIRLTTEIVEAVPPTADALAWLDSAFAGEVSAALAQGRRASEECLTGEHHAELFASVERDA